MRLPWLAGLVALLAGFPIAAWPQEKVSVVTTFSILGDLAQRVGGEHVEILTLVGPNGDAHVYQPGPRESAELATAGVLIANGLGFEPWLDRLVESSGFGGKLVIASEGVTPLASAEAHQGEEADAEHDHGASDPHAFQDLANAQIYVSNIAKGLAEAAPAHAADFKRNADQLSADIATLDAQLKADFAAIPQGRRRILTSHDAFRYFGRAYGIEFVSVQGVSTEAEASAADLARIIRQARDGHLSAIFLENMTDPRLAETVAQESGIRLGGELYADALSDASGPAPDYLSLVRYNAKQLLAAMQ
jgi:zinc/manganese transport system substrate-binding protein